MFEVYVHVPFCLRRCGYCDFNTYTAVDMGGGASRGNYANLAIREMSITRRWQEEHEIHEPRASSVFFGGGTPTLLPAADLTRMLDEVRQVWGVEPGAEITTEANPDTIDEAYLARLKAAGFTRVSMGMQSAVPHVLKTLDRTHTPRNVMENVQAAKSVGLDVSVDLIYGTPGESMEDWRTSVESALELGVDHVSAYALTVEPNTKMGRQIARGAISKPDDDDEAAKYELADDLFSQAGLQWYEISNWARPGHESRHNLGYWRNVDWAGIGPGAHSHYRTSRVGAWDIPVAPKSEEGFRRTVRVQDEDVDQVGMGACAQREVRGSAGHEVDPNAAAARDDGNSVRCGAFAVGGDESRGPKVDGGQFGIRSWDIAHPHRWADEVNARRIPWQGSESISHAEHLEETVMLGLRLREGLAISRIDEVAGRKFGEADFHDLVDEGLCRIHDDHIVVTRRGRLLNDTVISEILGMCV